VAIFLDRDGVINRQVIGDYVRSWEEFVFLPGVLDALAELASFVKPILVVTNQQGVGLGKMTREALDTIHERMKREIERHGGRIEGIYVCPHRADEQCDCRKPKPGLLYQAAREHGITLGEAWLVGDSGTDVVAGNAAGCRTILVGPRRDEERAWALARNASPTFEAEDLTEAIRKLRRMLPEKANSR